MRANVQVMTKDRQLPAGIRQDASERSRTRSMLPPAPAPHHHGRTQSSSAAARDTPAKDHMAETASQQDVGVNVLDNSNERVVLPPNCEVQSSLTDHSNNVLFLPVFIHPMS